MSTNATLDALVLEFRQYGERPNIGDDAVRRLRDTIAAETGGEVNPPLEDMGNNHTYWLARFIQWLLGHGVAPEPAPVTITITETVVSAFSPISDGQWASTEVPDFYDVEWGVNAATVIVRVPGTMTSMHCPITSLTGATVTLRVRAVVGGAVGAWGTQDSGIATPS